MGALIAVYPDHETAEEVVEELHMHGTVDDAALRLAEWDDIRASIRAEMDVEVDHGWASGVYGLMTSEMLRGGMLFGFVGGVIGLVVGVPIGLVLFDVSDAIGVRIGVGALIGLLFGSTVGALLGGGIAVKNPDAPFAAERGVPVVVEDPPPEAERVLVSHAPIRVDRFEDGHRVETLTPDGAHGAAGAVGEAVGRFVANAKDPSRR